MSESASNKLRKALVARFFYFTLLCFWSAQITVLNAQDGIDVQTSTIDINSASLDSLFSWLDNNIEAKFEVYQPIASHTLDKAYQSEDIYNKAYIHKLIADWHGYNGIFSQDSTIYHSKKSLSFYRENGDQLEVANALKRISIDYLNGAENELALEAIFEALAIYEKLEDENGIAGLYKNLSSLYTITEEGEKSIEYANKAITILSKNKDYYTLAITYLNLIQGYTMTEEYQKALEAAETCISIVETEIPDQFGILLRAHSWRYDVYLALKDYEKAEEDALVAWKIAKDWVGEERAATYRVEIGNSLLLQGKSVEALPHLEAGVKLYEMKEMTNSSSPYELLANAYEETSNFEKALKYQKKVKEIETAILNSKVENLKSESVVKYETAQKDLEILSQQAKIKQKTTIQWLMVSVAIILSFLLFLLYSSFRKNRSTTKKLELKNQENELLLKEIHHRVKNNLQTISSLLNLQSESIKDEAAFDAVQESKNRVASMALIHQKLYQGENLAAIEMKDYFTTIGRAVKESFGEKARHIELQVEMNEIELDVDTAVPIGLITNELLTNALKYAFPNQKSGSITISMSKTQENVILLEINDDGIGLHGQGESKGFGALLVQLLTTQIGGTLEKSTSDGTSVLLRFEEQRKTAA